MGDRALRGDEVMTVFALGDRFRPAAEAIFGTRLSAAERYVWHLAHSGTERGLIGPREAPRLWERHILNCAVVAELIPENSDVADVGSGAGLPGLCLALCREDLSVTLIEPLERRVQWLDEVVTDLGLHDSIKIVHGRAENVIDFVNVNVVTARAVTALVKLIPLAVPLLHGQGELLAIKGRSAETEVLSAAKAVKKYHLRDVEVLTVGADVLVDPTTVVRAHLS